MTAALPEAAPRPDPSPETKTGEERWRAAGQDSTTASCMPCIAGFSPPSTSPTPLPVLHTTPTDERQGSKHHKSLNTAPPTDIENQTRLMWSTDPTDGERTSIQNSTTIITDMPAKSGVWPRLWSPVRSTKAMDALHSLLRSSGWHV